MRYEKNRKEKLIRIRCDVFPDFVLETGYYSKNGLNVNIFIPTKNEFWSAKKIEFIQKI